MGKGDKRRPTQVDEDTFSSRWAKVFGAKPDEMMEPWQECEVRERLDPDINPSAFDERED